MDEHWKPVPSRLGVMASSWGRIKLPDGIAKMPNGGVRSYQPKPTYGVKTRASKTARHKYMGIYNKKFGNMKIHRLVCEAFHGLAPFDRAVVLHLDENALNNRPENLRWGTQKENLNMPNFIEYCKSRTGENSPVAKSIKQKLKLGAE
jgi:hypothetical protein